MEVTISSKVRLAPRFLCHKIVGSLAMFRIGVVAVAVETLAIGVAIGTLFFKLCRSHCYQWHLTKVVLQIFSTTGVI